MTPRLAEATALHTRLLKCTLELENSRAWWTRPAHVEGDDVVMRAFEKSWFGSRSLGRVRVLVANMRARFDQSPLGQNALRALRHAEPGTRALICHWHIQFSDPLYRAFSGGYLVERHDGQRAEVTRDQVTRWVSSQAPGRWTTRTQVQFASQLLATAKAAGLVLNLKDPRRLAFPRIPNDALAYLLYFLRDADFAGTLLENPYLASVGLTQRSLVEDRLRLLPALRYQRQGTLVDFGWAHRDLDDWARAGFADDVRAHP